MEALSDAAIPAAAGVTVELKPGWFQDSGSCEKAWCETSRFCPWSEADELTGIQPTSADGHPAGTKEEAVCSQCAVCDDVGTSPRKSRFGVYSTQATTGSRALRTKP